MLMLSIAPITKSVPVSIYYCLVDLAPTDQTNFDFAFRLQHTQPLTSLLSVHPLRCYHYALGLRTEVESVAHFIFRFSNQRT